MLRFCALFILFLSWLSTLAQNPVFRHFSVDEGLPSSEVYQIRQDKLGYLWFATDGGVARYDGYTFEAFTIDNGLPDNTVFNIYVDSKNRIWFTSILGTLSWYDYADNEIHVHPANEELSVMRARYRGYNSIYVGPSDTLWISLYRGGDGIKQLKIDPEGTIERVEIAEEKGTPWRLIINERRNGEIDEMSVTRATNYVRDQGKYLTVNSTEWTTEVDFSHHGEVNPRPSAVKLKDGRFVVGHGQRLALISSNGMDAEHLLPKGLNKALTIDRENNVWAGVGAMGVFCFTNGNFEEQRQFLEGRSVSYILQDHEGGYWFSTLEDGVFYARSMDLQSWWGGGIVEGVKIIALAKYGKSVLAGARNGTIYKISKSGSGYEHTFFGKIFEIWSLNNITDSIIAISPTIRNQTEKEKLKFSDGLFGVDSCFVQSNLRSVIWSHDKKTLYSGGRSFICRADPTTFLTTHRIIIFEGRVTSLFSASDGRLWVGMDQGLYELVGDSLVDHRAAYKGLDTRVSAMVEMQGNLVIGTRGHGLVIKKGDRFQTITEEDELPSGLIRVLKKENDSTLWVGTRKGLTRIHFKSFSPIVYNVSSYLPDDGLSSGEINDLLIQDEMIWVATGRGLSIFNKSLDITNRIPPPVHITGLKVNSTEVSLEDELVFKHNRNNLTLKFTGISFKTVGGLKYRYRIKELSEDWSITKGTEVQYPALPNGEYTFELRAQNSSGIWSEEPAIIKFSILPPFWQTWWFISLAIITFIGLSWLGFFLRFRTQRVQVELRRRSLESEQRALRAQMTPHFMFNALNSIQLMIANNDRIFAVTNVAKFARLMRNILTNSNQAFISLEKEVESLHLYLELESLRFKGKFNYTIDLSPDIDPSKVKIPPMLLQPYVENAIWHGIMKKEEPGGKVEINLGLEDQVLVCWITDDGIGRSRAAALAAKQVKTHQSMGMKITADRVRNINQQLGTKLDVQVEDLTDSAGNPTGTRVILLIPV